MKRKVLAVTGSRAEYGAMRPVLRAIAESPGLHLELIVTGMHLAPQFGASLAEIESDDFGPRHRVAVYPVNGSNLAMAMAIALGDGITAIAHTMARVAPAVVLIQGDRGEMLAAAAAAAHLNLPVVHMSGGDRTGSIDDSIRNAITSFAHVHLTTCAESTARIIAMGESSARVFEVGEPNLDVILDLPSLSWPELATELGLHAERPLILATQHPVTTEAAQAGEQVTETLEALAATGMECVFTYPNTDAGSDAILAVLKAWSGRDFLHVVPHVGSIKYLNLMRKAAVLVGNSSSGIIEAPSFKIPVVNIGSRQHRRTRACNVIDTGYERQQIRAAIDRALNDSDFRSGLADCRNPYGDGGCAKRTVSILERLRLDAAFISKWLARSEPIVDP